MQIEGGGVAFFVTHQLAVTARGCVRSDWRFEPEVTLIDWTRHLKVPSRVVAENQHLGIALVETRAPLTGVEPLSLASPGGSRRPVVGAFGPHGTPGMPLVAEGAVVGMVTGTPAGAVPAEEIEKLIAFYRKAVGCGPEGLERAEPVVYDSAVEGLFLHGLGALVTPSLKEKLRKLGLDLDHVLRPSYPRAVWIRILAATAAELFPGDEEGHRKLGRLSIHGLSKTLVGSALKGLSLLLGPPGAVHWFSEGIPSVNNFMRFEVHNLAPGRFRVLLNETYQCPGYVQGAIEGALAAVGARDLQVIIQEATAWTVCMGISWRPDGQERGASASAS